MNSMKPTTARLRGRPVTYTEVGAGPVLLLVHGMGGSYETWREVIEPLTTLVGHSLGGGIAMQLARQFPELAERLVPVSSGGLGPEVSLFLRAAALPGSELWIAATARTASWAAAGIGRGLAAVGLRPTTDVAEVARRYASLVDPARRAAFLATLRSVINVGGHRIDARDRLYLAAGIPVLILWGARDPVIPVGHGERAHEAIAGSRLEIFDGVGHIPQLEAPARFVAVLERFLEETEPARFDAAEWRVRFKTTDEPHRARTSRGAAG